MAERRHLPVIASADTHQPSAQRSMAQWIVAATVLIVALSFPLSMLGLWGSRALSSALLQFDGTKRSAGWINLAALLPVLASFSLAAYVGGLVVVRWGVRVSVSKLALIGAIAGATLATLAVAAGTLRPWQIGATAYVVLMAIGAGSAAGAGLSGRKARNTATLRRVSLPSVTAPSIDPSGEVTGRHESNR